MEPACKYWVEQLAQHLRETVDNATRATQDAAEAARTMATESEKREDSRVMLEYGGMATGQNARAQAAQEALAVLSQFFGSGLPRFRATSPIGLGAIVDVAIETEHGNEERTFILLPTGAGTELEGPGGDGFLTVITPASPVGRALLGKGVGDVAEITLRGEPFDWTVVGVS